MNNTQSDKMAGMSSNNEPVKMNRSVVAADDALGYDLPNMTPNEIMDAYHAALSEHRMSAPDAFRLYWKGLLWAAVISMVGRLGALRLYERLTRPPVGMRDGIIRFESERFIFRLASISKAIWQYGQGSAKQLSGGSQVAISIL